MTSTEKDGIEDQKPERESWPLDEDFDSRDRRLHRLAVVIKKRDMEDLKAGIEQGLNLNEWYNSNPGALKISVGRGAVTPSHLLRVHENDRMMALHLATASSWTEGVAVLINCGADVNAWDLRVSPHLHYKDTSYTPLMHACCYASVPMVKLLLEAGADPSAVDPEGGSTPFSLATTYFSFPVLKLLLEHGAQMTEQDSAGMPLQDAVEVFINPLLKIPNAHQLNPEELQDKTEEVRATALRLMEMLLESGADPNRPQDDSLPPLHLCAEGCRGDLRGLELLAKHGADVDLLTGGAFYHQYSHLTPLLTAVTSDDSLPAVRWLIRNGADVDQKFQRYHRSRKVGLPLSLLAIALEDRVEQVAAVLVHSGCVVTKQNVDMMNTLLVESQDIEKEHFQQTEQHVPSLVAVVDCYKDILDFVKKPQSLKWQVRRALRSKFGMRQPKHVEHLPLPPAMKKYIMCHDI